MDEAGHGRAWCRGEEVTGPRPLRSLTGSMRRLLWLTVALPACAPALVLPPPAVPATEWEQPLATPIAVPEVEPGAPAVRHDYDSTAGYTRRLVTTHSGAYTGWVQKPQVSFFALTRGTEAPRHMPASIGLVVRTLEPTALTGPQLILRCATVADTVPVAVHSHVAPTGNTHSHFLTYLLPTERVAAFAGCPEGTLHLGQTSTHFTAALLSGIRALLLELGATRRAGVT